MKLKKHVLCQQEAYFYLQLKAALGDEYLIAPKMALQYELPRDEHHVREHSWMIVDYGILRRGNFSIVAVVMHQPQDTPFEHKYIGENLCKQNHIPFIKMDTYSFHSLDDIVEAVTEVDMQQALRFKQ